MRVQRLETVVLGLEEGDAGGQLGAVAGGVGDVGLVADEEGLGNEGRRSVKGGSVGFAICHVVHTCPSYAAM